MTNYILRIDTEESNYFNVSSILNVSPTKTTDYYWEYSIGEDSELYIKAILFLTSLIKPNISKLKSLGIKSDDITIWFYKPYEGQCNMEFSPKEMKEMALCGITLCISCWET